MGDIRKRVFLFCLVSILIACNTDEKENRIDPIIEQKLNGIYNDSALSYQDYINLHYQVFAMPLPHDLHLCGDQVPLDKLHVREQLDREILVNTYWHSNTFLYQKRAARWFPSIERILQQQGVPDDIKYLAVIESGLSNSVSPAGATGFWQFMKETAEEYGLEVNQYVDERYHLEKSTVAACKYMKSAYQMFGSWSLAAASYNNGKGAIQHALEKQKVDSYFDLYLNEETARYVYRVLAAKLILSNSKNFGFHFRRSDTYEPYSYYTIQVDTPIEDLPQFAIDLGINYYLLKLLNPWIMNYSLPNDGKKTYTLKIPKGDFHDVHLEESDSTNIESEELAIDTLKTKPTDANRKAK